MTFLVDFLQAHTDIANAVAALASTSVAVIALAVSLVSVDSAKTQFDVAQTTSNVTVQPATCRHRTRQWRYSAREQAEA